MAKNRKHTAEFKLQIIKNNHRGDSIRSLSGKWNISTSLIRKWLDHHRSNGAKGLLAKNRVYHTKEFKFIAVRAPGTKLNLNLKINSTSFTFRNTKSSTLKIPNAFPNKGMFNIFIESHLYKDSGESINGMNIKYSLEIK